MRNSCSPNVGSSMRTRTPPNKLVTSHLRLVARIAMGYRGYGLPIGEVISEGNVGLMQAVKRFDPDKGFRLATYAMWWIRASIQEYILRSWSLVKMGTTAAQKKLFFNLRRAEEPAAGARRWRSETRTRQENCRQARRAGRRRRQHEPSAWRRRVAQRSDPRRYESGEWQDWLVDDKPTQEDRLVEDEELERRKSYLSSAMSVL